MHKNHENIHYTLVLLLRKSDTPFQTVLRTVGMIPSPLNKRSPNVLEGFPLLLIKMWNTKMGF